MFICHFLNDSRNHSILNCLPELLTLLSQHFFSLHLLLSNALFLLFPYVYCLIPSPPPQTHTLECKLHEERGFYLFTDVSIPSPSVPSAQALFPGLQALSGSAFHLSEPGKSSRNPTRSSAPHARSSVSPQSRPDVTLARDAFQSLSEVAHVRRLSPALLYESRSVPRPRLRRSPSGSFSR